MAPTSVFRAVLTSLLCAALGGCAGSGGVIAGKADWATLSSGSGSIETRVVNDSGEAITVRIEDENNKILAQAPLAPREGQTLNLPKGSVRATVRVERDGRAQYSDAQTFEVKPGAKPAEWRFTPPSIE